MGRFDDDDGAQRLSTTAILAAAEMQCGLALLAGVPDYEPPQDEWFPGAMTRRPPPVRPGCV